MWKCFALFTIILKFQVDVADFLDLIDDEEIELIKRDAFEQVNSLIKYLDK